jgi:hypothetical protein
MMPELVQSGNGEIVFVVIDPEDCTNVGGVYRSVERAADYIRDWLVAGDLPVRDTTPTVTQDGTVWQFCGYYIVKTEMRP